MRLNFPAFEDAMKQEDVPPVIFDSPSVVGIKRQIHGPNVMFSSESL